MIRIPVVLLLLFMLGNAYTGTLQSKDGGKRDDNHFKYMSPEFLYSYLDFDFDSTTEGLFNRFQGYSNLYSTGVDHYRINPETELGLYVFKVDTNVNSQLLLIQGAQANTHQTLHNSTLFGHIRRFIGVHYSLDLAGAWGQNKIDASTLISQPDALDQTGFASYNNVNWFTSLYGAYYKTWHSTLFKAYAGVLYSQINSGSYRIDFQPVPITQNVQPLRNQITYITEALEISHPITDHLTPFINGGLIQVADYQNSRAVFVTPVSGILPQLNLNKNGYRVGGGVVLNYQRYTIRIEDKYYAAGGTFASNQALIGLEVRFA